MEFDPSAISCGKLLDLFRASHDPRERPRRRRYLSAIIFHNDEQKKMAIGRRSREAGGLGLSTAGMERLEEIVCSHGAKERRGTGAACPAG